MSSNRDNTPPPGRPPRRGTSTSIQKTSTRGSLRERPPATPPGTVPPRRWEPRRSREYVVSTWRFQKRLVQIWLIPTPLCLLYLFGWSTRNPKGLPPLWVIATLLTSVGFTLALAFLYWRCPDCERILFRTSSSGAVGLFFLADPEYCPECGAPLSPPPPPGKEEKTGSFKDLS